jgi:hypothetical protein
MQQLLSLTLLFAFAVREALSLTALPGGRTGRLGSGGRRGSSSSDCSGEACKGCLEVTDLTNTHTCGWCGDASGFCYDIDVSSACSDTCYSLYSNSDCNDEHEDDRAVGGICENLPPAPTPAPPAPVPPADCCPSFSGDCGTCVSSTACGGYCWWFPDSTSIQPSCRADMMGTRTCPAPGPVWPTPAPPTPAPAPAPVWPTPQPVYPTPGYTPAPVPVPEDNTGMYAGICVGLFLLVGCCRRGPQGFYDDTMCCCCGTCYDLWTPCFGDEEEQNLLKKKREKKSGSQPESPSPYVAMTDAPVGNSVQRDDFCISCRAPNPESKPFCANCGSRTS